MIDRFRFRAWNKKAKMLVDLKEVTPLALDPTLIQDGIFIPFHEDLIIEQCTGLKDKNNDLIFENDVIQGDLFDSRLPTMGRIAMDDSGCWSSQNEAGHTHLYKINNIDIVGNIHSDERLSELLESR